MHLQTLPLPPTHRTPARTTQRLPIRSIVITVLTLVTVLMVVLSLATQANIYCMAVMQIFLGAQFLARHLHLLSPMTGFQKLSVTTGLLCLGIGLIILALALVRD